MALISDVISFSSGVVAGLFTNALWDQRRYARRILAPLMERKRPGFGSDSATLDLYPINRWSPSRPLDRHRLKMQISSVRPETAWMDTAEWQQLVDDLSATASGSTAYLTDYSIDHRESASGHIFSYTVCPCTYSEHLGTVRYLEDHPEIQDVIRATLSSGQSLAFARSSPPSIIKINVAVLSESDHFLAVKRSGAVHAKKGLWTVGPNETMALPTHSVPGMPPEDLFGLAERCLREEVGLEVNDYYKMNISWIGHEAATASVKVYAQVRTSLPNDDLVERMNASHGLFEIQDFSWLPLSRGIVADITKNWNRGDRLGRIWSSSAPLALHELRRFRHALDD